MNDEEKKNGVDQNHCLASGCRLHGRYVTERVLGEGGFGITYEGWDESLNIQIAIKEYFPVGKVYRQRETNEVIAFNRECAIDFKHGLDRYVLEADILSKFYQEEGIVSVRDFFQENNTAYIIMEYLDGITLRKFVQTNGRLSMDDVRGIVHPIVKAMGMVHREGILHRDISPDNIMITLDDKVKLIDFGSARDFCYEPEKTATVILRQGFAPIEQYQAHGEQGTWTDVYALCGTIYYLLTAQEPPDTMERIIVDYLKPLSDYGVMLPRWQEQAVMNGLGIYRENRYKTMEEMWHQIFEPSRNLKWYLQVLYKPHERMWKRAAALFMTIMTTGAVGGGILYGMSGGEGNGEAGASKLRTDLPVVSTVIPESVSREGTERVTIPKVEHMSLAKAKKILKKQELSWKVKRHYHNKIPEGNVIRQGQKLQKDSDGNDYIKLTVSKGKKPVTPTKQPPVQTIEPLPTSQNKVTAAPKTSGKNNRKDHFRVDSGESEEFIPEQ